MNLAWACYVTIACGDISCEPCILTVLVEKSHVICSMSSVPVNNNVCTDALFTVPVARACVLMCPRNTVKVNLFNCMVPVDEYAGDCWCVFRCVWLNSTLSVYLLTVPVYENDLMLYLRQCVYGYIGYELLWFRVARAPTT